MTDFTMIILAGGMSRRMGCNKADLLLGTHSFLETQVQKGIALGAREILVSGYQGSQTGFRTVADRLPNHGPLAGLEACLRTAACETCLVLSVDTPLVPESELQQLLNFSRSAGSPITITKCGNREQPLAGIYHRSLADSMLQELTEGKGSVFAFLNTVGYAVYESSAPAHLFSNVNTPEEYAALGPSEQ